MADPGMTEVELLPAGNDGVRTSEEVAPDEPLALVEALRDRIAELEAVTSASTSTLDRLPRAAEEGGARAVSQLGRLVEHLARQMTELLRTADGAVAVLARAQARRRAPPGSTGGDG